MKIPLAETEIDIPEGVQVEVDGPVVRVSGDKGSLERTFDHPAVKIAADDDVINVSAEFPRSREKALVGTYASHIKNMIKGVTEGFTYRMKVVYSHFPVKVSVKDDHVLIDNFLGEQYPRSADILGDVTVTVKGDDVTLEGPNKENVGQTAANIERAVRVRRRDIRVFQDGIYITEKGA